MEMLKVADSAGYTWEDVKPPSPSPPPSGENAHLIPPNPVSKPQQLCGYLSKATRGPIKTWRSRWFVFEDHRCCLFYYSTQADFTPQGCINISNAAFSYSVEDSSKFQFEIRADGRVHSLQASSRDAMFYWLNQLQSRRKKYSKHTKKVAFKQRNEEGGEVAVGSGECDSDDDKDWDKVPDEIPDLKALPVEVQENRGGRPQLSSGSSFRERLSLKQQITGLFRPGQSPNPQQQQSSSDSPRIKKRSELLVEPLVRDIGEASSGGFEASPEHTSATLTRSSISDPPRISLSRKFLNKVTRHSQVLSGPYPGDCLQCHMNKTKMEELELELQRKDQEVSDREAVNEFLRNEIRLAEMKNKVKEELMTSSTPGVNMEDDKKVDILLQRDQTIAEYQRLLEEATREKERLAVEIETKKHEVQVLAEQIDLFTEAVAAKDHVVVELTNKLFQLENKGQMLTDPSDAMKPATTQSLELELQRMKEAVEAYKNQNQFLSTELLEMNQLRSDDLAVNKQLVHDLHELEAKFIRLESKYLVLLKESQEPQRGKDTGPSPDLVSQMMEEALGQSDVSKEHFEESFDVYGFCHSQHDSLQGDDDALRIKVRKNELDAHRVLEEMDAQHKLQWDVLWSQHVGTRHLPRSTHLKQLIRKGIPRDYRSEVWKWIVKDTLKESYQPGMYAELMKKHVDQTSIAMNQIELDLYRTLPTHKNYKADGEWINKLRRVLVAFSWYDTSIGYCQGLNRLAAIALLFLDEEHAFWCLVTIVHHHLPRDYYDRSLLGSQADQRVLKDILKERAPVLTQHLAQCDIDFSLITFNWFHTIFVDTMPSDTMIRIWDTFLYEGSKVLFRYAVAIFLYNQDQLLAEGNSIAIFNQLRSMCKEATDIRRLTEIAFNEITRFSMDAIRRKRDYYHKQIRGEIEALDKLRAAVIPVHNKDDDQPESEEEICEPQATNYQ